MKLKKKNLKKWKNKKRKSFSTIFLLRPLLESTRFDLKRLCQIWNLPVYPDVTNQNFTSTRNRIRLQLLPILRFFFNPQIDTIFTQFAQINLQEQDYLNYLTTRLIKDLFTKKKFLQNKSINFFKNISYKRKLYFYRVKTKENGGKLKEIQFYQGFGKAYFALHFIDKMSADGAFGCAFCKQNARQRKLNLRQTKTIISKKKNSSFSWVHFAQQNAPIVHSTHAPRGRLRQSRHGDTNNYHSGCAFCFAKCNTVVQNPHDACAFCKAKCKTIATSYASQEGCAKMHFCNAVCVANCLHGSKINWSILRSKMHPSSQGQFWQNRHESKINCLTFCDAKCLRHVLHKFEFQNQPLFFVPLAIQKRIIKKLIESFLNKKVNFFHVEQIMRYLKDSQNVV